MKTAQDIINNARFELVEQLITLMRKIDAYLETGDKRLMTNSEEGVVVAFADCVSAPSTVSEVVMSYLDAEETCREVRSLDFIATCDDYNLFVVAAADTEISAEDISTDDLLVIAKVLEETYKDMK